MKSFKQLSVELSRLEEILEDFERLSKAFESLSRWEYTSVKIQTPSIDWVDISLELNHYEKTFLAASISNFIDKCFLAAIGLADELELNILDELIAKLPMALKTNPRGYLRYTNQVLKGEFE